MNELFHPLHCSYLRDVASIELNGNSSNKKKTHNNNNQQSLKA